MTFHLPSELMLLDGSGPHEGNIFLDGRPICDDKHTDDEHGRQNALVVCRSENIPTQPNPIRLKISMLLLKKISMFLIIKREPSQNAWISQWQFHEQVPLWKCAKQLYHE